MAGTATASDSVATATEPDAGAFDVPRAATAVLPKPPVEISADQPRRRRRWLRWLAMILAAIVVLALLAATGWLTFEHRQADARAAKRQEFVQAARQTALNLTTIHVDTAKADVERILDNSTGSFKAEFDGRIDPFVSVVQTAKVNTDGQIIEAGIERESGDTADVLVAARSMVTNAGNDKPQPRDFRLRVTVTKVDGKLLTSNVEFVP